MTQPWHATKSSLHINLMPFYWRLSESSIPFSGIPKQLPIRVMADEQFDYLKLCYLASEWSAISTAYHQNENIGFLNPESGQMTTYGASVNNFFLNKIQGAQPKNIYEIGCGAGYSIRFLKKHGFNVTGIDPSEYSLHWSERLGFALINNFFSEGLLLKKPDFIYCNDVFEHVPDILDFSRAVYKCLDFDGTFCIATTNSQRSIELGDISMLEHQHVNMFTERSLRLILRHAGFSSVEIKSGSYGNTFHVVARKLRQPNAATDLEGSIHCLGFFERASKKIEAFGRYYKQDGSLNCYVPLRCIPYLATVSDMGMTPIYDSNIAWRGKYIDGYDQPIRSLGDVTFQKLNRFFVGSITFYRQIQESLISCGYSPDFIITAESL